MVNGPPMMDLAVQFLLRESTALGWALRQPRDPERIRQVLRWHDEAHRAWLSLLASCRRAGWPCVDSLDRLYAVHGQVAEMLEHGPVSDDAAARRARAELATHLSDTARKAVADICADARNEALAGRPRGGRVGTAGTATRTLPPTPVEGQP